MTVFKQVALLAVAGFLLAACAAKPIPYDRGATEIKTIAVVTPYFPDGPNVPMASSVGQSFGLIGALIDAGIQANRESRFKKILTDANYTAPQEFMGDLVSNLEGHGYSLSMLEVKRGSADFLATYPKDSEPKPDAFLDMVATYGYITAGLGEATPYRPNVTVRVRLVKAADSSVLMQDAVVYNPVGPYQQQFLKGVSLPPDAEYQFSDFDLLMADPKKAVEGLDIAVNKSAVAVADLLK